MKAFIAAVVVAFIPQVHAQTTMGVAAGQKGSTIFEMMTDVQKVCKNPALNVVTSEGSLDNIERIAGDKAVQLGYTQEDAAVYKQGQDPRMMSNIQMVFPLIQAELHIIVAANSSIKTLADLQGKKVVESEEGTGTWVTAQVIKSVTKISWSALNMNKAQSIKAVEDGTADAAIFVEGRPIGSFANAKGVRLIPINHPGLDSFKYYTKTMIPSATYSWQSGVVSTYKVNIGLMTYAYKNQYQKEIGDLVTCITRNLGTLQTNGHAKWRDVDPLDIERMSWPVHPSALAAIKREAKQKK